jgi:hypothetical protein
VIDRPGKQSQLCDSLSRYPFGDSEEPDNYLSEAPLFFIPRFDLAAAQTEDSFLKAIIDVLEGDTKTTTYRNRILYYVLKSNVLY